MVLLHNVRNKRYLKRVYEERVSYFVIKDIRIFLLGFSKRRGGGGRSSALPEYPIIPMLHP